MRRLVALVSTSVLFAGVLLVGAGSAGVSAQDVAYAASGWSCSPRGTIAGSPTTTLSIAVVSLASPASSRLNCVFRGTPLANSSGGPCRYEDARVIVDFGFRSLVGAIWGGRLDCWGATTTTKTDLSVAKTDDSSTATRGSTTTYTIVVTNAGLGAVSGAAVADTFPAAITSDTYTSVAAGGATGNTAAGTGNIADTVTLPVGATITYTVVATIAPEATGTLTNTATVTAGPGAIDTDPSNNSATDIDTLVGRTLSTTVSNFSGRDTRLFDLISYGTSQCAAQPEDGVTACTESVANGTVVTVNLQDESYFAYTCPGASEQIATGMGPFSGQCLVMMDADKQITVIGDIIL